MKDDEHVDDEDDEYEIYHDESEEEDGVDGDVDGSGGNEIVAGVEALEETPDGGCLCYVLRTGFSSSQVCCSAMF